MRVRALLLLALFLGAGTSLPGLDAVLYHRHPDLRADQIHFDPVGGCGGHADHCTLGRTPPGSGSVQPLALEIRLAAHDARASVPPPSSQAIVSLRRTLPQSRAPPAASV